MSEGCNHDCGSCSAGCDKKDFMEPQNKYSNIKEVIAVISGKGGVGKSLTTGLLAECAKKAGYDELSYPVEGKIVHIKL